jgi:hypothetical protein
MNELHAATVGILGPAIDHQRSLQAMLAGHAARVVPMADSFSALGGAPQGRWARMVRQWDQLSHTHNKAYQRSVCDAIDRDQIKVVVGFWGTNPLSDLLAIKRLRPHVRLVLMVLCHPQALDHWGFMRQQFMMKRAAKVLDGFLLSNPEMAQFFQDRCVGAGGARLCVVKPCWPAAFHAEERSTAIDQRGNLVFIGRTDLAHHTVHAADDMRRHMEAMLDAGVHLHHCRSKETDDGHPLRHPFKPMVQAELIRVMGRYDASWIAYNTDACVRKERFELTVPDRLITSVAAGVPIALPTQGYGGARSYLDRYPAVFSFSSPAELRAQLSDRRHVAAMSDAAWRAREDYTAEGQGHVLASFLASLLR